MIIATRTGVLPQDGPATLPPQTQNIRQLIRLMIRVVRAPHHWSALHNLQPAGHALDFVRRKLLEKARRGLPVA